MPRNRGEFDDGHQHAGHFSPHEWREVALEPRRTQQEMLNRKRRQAGQKEIPYNVPRLSRSEYLKEKKTKHDAALAAASADYFSKNPDSPLRAHHDKRNENDDLGDLVDPQNDTYEEEGTHGPALVVGAAAKAAAKGYMAARSNPKTGPLIKAGEQAVIEKGKEAAGVVREKGTEVAGKAMTALKGKLDR